MNIRDKQLYNLLEDLAIDYITKLTEFEEDMSKIIFYKGKIEAINDICDYINVPMFNELSQIIIEESSKKFEED